ncbi:hypothetical protein BD410DRAFT_786537 [Rickenella mellea]|uniref:Uncharacterized protein n=1 Tax=Rickenella mellea TaxID=50990 RepID=A0A4Y7QAM3_9AGAM|nr:hypothetical protein BD410DRAFT_786537 [Rickenella mellea]
MAIVAGWQQDGINMVALLSISPSTSTTHYTPRLNCNHRLCPNYSQTSRSKMIGKLGQYFRKAEPEHNLEMAKDRIRKLTTKIETYNSKTLKKDFDSIKAFYLGLYEALKLNPKQKHHHLKGTIDLINQINYFERKHWDAIYGHSRDSMDPYYAARPKPRPRSKSTHDGHHRYQESLPDRHSNQYMGYSSHRGPYSSAHRTTHTSHERPYSSRRPRSSSVGYSRSPFAERNYDPTYASGGWTGTQQIFKHRPHSYVPLPNMSPVRGPGEKHPRRVSFSVTSTKDTTRTPPAGRYTTRRSTVHPRAYAAEPIFPL